MGQDFCPIFFEAMKEPTRRALFFLAIALLALDFYAIFNAGNPRSLFRFLLPEPRYDVLLTLNRGYILELRRRGKSDEEIADSFLNELKAPPGLLRSLARRRVLRYLSKLK
jgi:hypothetical protein